MKILGVQIGKENVQEQALTAVNVHTDKEYFFASENEFGLSWTYHTNARVFTLTQKTGHDDDSWFVKAHCRDMSITNFETETVEIPA